MQGVASARCHIHVLSATSSVATTLKDPTDPSILKYPSFRIWVPSGVNITANSHPHRRRIVGATASRYENVLPAPPRENNPYPCFDALLDQASSSAGNSLSPPASKPDGNWAIRFEELIERAIFNCRFLTLMAIGGSLAGSVLCFFKGCAFVLESFVEYFHTCFHGSSTGQVILLLVEAVDVYLMGTVMLIFGMGLYELFVSSLEVPGGNCFNTGTRSTVCGSNFFGLFRLRERPKWLEIRSLDELKTKLGHVIVMILLVGMFEKSKKVPIHTGVDLLCFSASILLASGCLFLLSKLHATK